MFKWFFWKWFKQPRVGEIWTHEESNPFKRCQIKILEIREDWAKVERFSHDFPKAKKEDDVIKLQSIISFYKKEG